MIALDTETPGLDLATAKVVQLAIVGKEFQYLEPVNPGCAIPKEASDWLQSSHLRYPTHH